MALFPLGPIWDMTINGEAPVDYRGLDRNDRVKYMRVKAIWIHHGFWAGIESVFSGLLTANSVTHWWVELETERGWYCVQFDKPRLTITKFKNKAGVTACGFRAAGFAAGEDKNITVKYSENVGGRRTMGDVADFVRGYAQNGRYDLINNNCQDFGKSFYRWI